MSMLIIVPTRGRPGSVAPLVQAWHDTEAFTDGAALCFAIDVDDPAHVDYTRALIEAARSVSVGGLQLYAIATWRPMVGKLNAAARHYAHGYSVLGFAGDDHIPRTPGWARQYMGTLAGMGTGIVYGDDGYKGERLPTQWAMTADIIQALGCMVPGDVEHLYCDDIIKTLGQQAECLRYLPDVLIEHMHPVAGKAAMDHGYSRVNHPDQYDRDGDAFSRWVRDRADADAAIVRGLKGVRGGE